MTEQPVHVVRLYDPKDTTQVLHIGPGTPAHLRTEQPALVLTQPETVGSLPGVHVIRCGAMQDPNHVHVIGIMPKDR